MRVFIYVEGPSDNAALSTLLIPLIDSKQEAGISIVFLPVTQGDHKEYLVTKVPIKAARMLAENPDLVVIIFPDLYPQNKGFPHQTYPELYHGVISRFNDELSRMGYADDPRIKSRFQVFCLKHDLEALLLAAEESLIARFGGSQLGVSWRKPVEDQNQNQPPKHVVEEIYRRHGQKYKDTVDASLILRGVSYQQIAERCPQCFKPFVDFLENLQNE
jgi:hypothetical protein